MEQVTKIIIVRHGESEANRDNICGGNSPLTEKGIEQANATKDLLARFTFDDAYSSDLGRAVHTAAIIAGHDIPQENRWAEFRERNFGALENKSNTAWIALKDIWEEKYRSLPFEERSRIDYADDIESDGALCDRVMNGLKKVAVSNPAKTLLVVSSAGPLRVLLMHLGFADFLTVGSFDNAGYVELDFDGQKFWIQEIVGVHKPALAK